VMAELDPEIGAGALPISGGKAAFAGLSRLSRAFSLGLGGPVSSAELDEIEAFYASRGAPVIIDLCPLADDAVREALTERGYRLTEFNQVWIRPLTREDRFEEVTGVFVRLAGKEDMELWSRLVGQGFSGQEDVPAETLLRGRVLFHLSCASCFIGQIAGEPEGAGAMFQQGGLVTLFATATLPRARRRGVQTALLHARLSSAAAAGCDLAVVITAPGSDSQRNVERLGFRLAYTKVELALPR
jgi:GNAT superfamily N-acetyltransferase